jgi:hypothetical protein
MRASDYVWTVVINGLAVSLFAVSLFEVYRGEMFLRNKKKTGKA